MVGGRKPVFCDMGKQHEIQISGSLNGVFLPHSCGPLPPTRGRRDRREHGRRRDVAEAACSLPPQSTLRGADGLFGGRTGLREPRQPAVCYSSEERETRLPPYGTSSSHAPPTWGHAQVHGGLLSAGPRSGRTASVRLSWGATSFLCLLTLSTHAGDLLWSWGLCNVIS